MLSKEDVLRLEKGDWVWVESEGRLFYMQIYKIDGDVIFFDTMFDKYITVIDDIKIYKEKPDGFREDL